jgi:hypothetical protein
VSVNDYHHAAAICRRGHVVEAALETLEGLMSFCMKCGSRVIIKCESCEAPILGATTVPWYRPSFCWKCGRAYPWATREQMLGKLYDTLDDSHDLDEAELLIVREQIAVLTEPVDEVSDEEQVRAGERLRGLAPKAWEAAYRSSRAC